MKTGVPGQRQALMQVKTGSQALSSGKLVPLKKPLFGGFFNDTLFAGLGALLKMQYPVLIQKYPLKQPQRPAKGVETSFQGTFSHLYRNTCKTCHTIFFAVNLAHFPCCFSVHSFRYFFVLFLIFIGIVTGVFRRFFNINICSKTYH